MEASDRAVVYCPCSGKDNPAATARYEKALQQLKSGDLKVDFKALRVGCAASKLRV